MFHARTLGRLGLWEILVKRIFILCARVNLPGGDSRFSNFSKKWVKMVKLLDFYGILLYFEKKTYGELMSELGTSLIFFVKSIHCPLQGDSKKFPKFQIVWR